MNKKTLLLPLLSIAFFVASPVAFADSVYTSPSGTQYSVPTGYQPYAYGVYYNSGNVTYFNPLTGQTSQISPAGPALTASNGLPAIPAGYSSSLYGTYYNGSNGTYYDPVSGFMSYMTPPGPTIVGHVAPPNVQYATIYYPYAVAYPTATVYLPNTGAGGDATDTFVTLITSLGIAIAGGVFLVRSRNLA